MSSGDTLYERLGGRDGISDVVDDFYERVHEDEQLEIFFEDIDMERLRAHQTQFLANVTGGPVEYSGPNMFEAHKHLDIREDDFAAVAKHLQDSLETAGVPPEEIDQVLSAVAELKDQIIGRR